jgi:tetrahydromethanopterin S-methyltransferase subunit B
MSASEIVEQIRKEFIYDDMIAEQITELDRRSEDALNNLGRRNPAAQVFTEMRDRLNAKK